MLIFGFVSSIVLIGEARQKATNKKYIIWGETDEDISEVEEITDIKTLEEGETGSSAEAYRVVRMNEEGKEVIEKKTELIVEENIEKGNKKGVVAREWNMQMINADKVKIAEPEERVKVAIIDSGVDLSEDLNLVEAINYVNPEMTNPLFLDSSGHGTCIAGIIGAYENEVGITGINPYVEIYSAKVFDENNNGRLSDVVKGIYWAIEKKLTS